MMISAIDAIHMRRSIRAYRTEQLTDGQLQAILDAGLAAPSAVNRQPFHFSAVQDQALLTRINEATRQQILQAAPDEAAKKNLSDPSWSVFYHAPTVIFLSCPPLSQMRYAQTDSGIAIENMALAAVGLGLGSVILGRPRRHLQAQKRTNSAKRSVSPRDMTLSLRWPLAILQRSAARTPSAPD